MATPTPTPTATPSTNTATTTTGTAVDGVTEHYVAKAMKTEKGRVFRVVLTGGPCGGKTTASTAITDRLQNLGWRVFRVPEAANMLISGGMTFYNLTAEQQFTFQKALLKLMLQLEESFLDLAYSTSEKCIVIMDRGTMDCRAYMSEPDWQRMVTELGYNTVDLRDSRYDAVIHLVTAADGAENFYTTDGHASRSEPADVARAIDARIKGNWIGHPYFQVIDNRASQNTQNDFNLKINKVMTTICKFMGIRELGVTKRKFLVRTVGTINFPTDIKHTSFHVEHDYLLGSAQTQSRLRRRGQDGHYSYSYTIRYPDLHGQKLELKRVLTRREYADLILTKDPSRQTIVKQRVSFLYKNQYWELDTFQSPQPGLRLLEAYVDKTQVLQLPDFIDIAGDITEDTAYSMYNLAYVPGAAATAADVIRQHRSSSAASSSNSPSIISLTAPSSPQITSINHITTTIIQTKQQQQPTTTANTTNTNTSKLPASYAAMARRGPAPTTSTSSSTSTSTPSSPKSKSKSSHT